MDSRRVIFIIATEDTESQREIIRSRVEHLRTANLHCNKSSLGVLCDLCRYICFFSAAQEIEPQKEGVNRENGYHEKHPPNAEILPTAVTLLFCRRQREIAAIPDDAPGFFGWRRCREQRSDDHYAH